MKDPGSEWQQAGRVWMGGALGLVAMAFTLLIHTGRFSVFFGWLFLLFGCLLLLTWQVRRKT